MLFGRYQRVNHASRRNRLGKSLFMIVFSRLFGEIVIAIINGLRFYDQQLNVFAYSNLLSTEEKLHFLEDSQEKKFFFKSTEFLPGAKKNPSLLLTDQKS